jgi:hypothetical protein
MMKPVATVEASSYRRSNPPYANFREEEKEFTCYCSSSLLLLAIFAKCNKTTELLLSLQSAPTLWRYAAASGLSGGAL